MGRIATPANPAIEAAAVTPNDSVDLPSVSIGNETFASCNALMIATAGNIQLTTENGTTVTLAVPAGLLPIRARRIFSTSTTVTGISALY